MTEQGFPNPRRYFSEKSLNLTWHESRDSRGNAAIPGIDNVSPREFKNLLKYNIQKIIQRLRCGQYCFSPLKPIPIPKNRNSNKYRIICVPTVSDRLVQREIKYLLGNNSRIKQIQSPISFGVHSGKEWSTWAALKEAKQKRTNKKWVLKTDIQSFFDSVDRAILKKRIYALLGKSSLIPLLNQVIDTEISTHIDEFTKRKIQTTKIKPGIGLRQGMPLSPLLSNILLANFDREMTKRNIPVLRYVDDIIAFGNSLEEVKKLKIFIGAELKKLNLGIPDIEAEGKTSFANPEEPIVFLGVEISPSSSAEYNFKIPKVAMDEALVEIKEVCSLQNIRKRSLKYKDLVLRLERMGAGYKNYYKKDCTNFDFFDDRIKTTINAELKNVLYELLGRDLFLAFSPEAKNFMGINLS